MVVVIAHAEDRLDKKFEIQEFMNGTVAKALVDEDFEVLNKVRLVPYLLLNRSRPESRLYDHLKLVLREFSRPGANFCCFTLKTVSPAT